MPFNRCAVVLTSAAAALLLLATPALAHVTVQGPGATQGGYTKLTFRVPTERDINTTKLEIVFPADAPLAAARVKPHVGWTFTVKKAKPATALTDDDGNTIDQIVSSITWTATNGGITPTEFDEFEVSAGPLPKKEEMVFKALQTYSDGQVVRWIEGKDGEHPAPVLKLAAAGSSAAPTPSASASATAGLAATAAADDSDNLGGYGLALGALALLVALAALVRSGRGTN